MRGKGIDIARQKFEERITPAYAGKRAGQALWDFGKEDHPRLCGEKLLTSRSVVWK